MVVSLQSKWEEYLCDSGTLNFVTELLIIQLRPLLLLALISCTYSTHLGGSHGMRVTFTLNGDKFQMLGAPIKSPIPAEELTRTFPTLGMRAGFHLVTTNFLREFNEPIERLVARRVIRQVGVSSVLLLETLRMLEAGMPGSTLIIRQHPFAVRARHTHVHQLIKRHFIQMSY